MSQQNNIDQERYFSDPEYRRQIAQESGIRSTSTSGLKQALIGGLKPTQNITFQMN